MNIKEFDYKAIGHIYFHDPLSGTYKVPSLFHCIFYYLALLVLYLFRMRTSFPAVGDVCFITSSINNTRAMEPIAKKLGQQNKDIMDMLSLPVTRVFLKSIRTWNQFFMFYKNSTLVERKIIRNDFNYFVNAPGYYEVSKDFILRNKQLRYIVVSNDHFMIMRCLLEAARQVNVPVIYVQHASVTSRFPPLHFAYSFLDGWESYEKYKEVGDITGKVIVLGSPRFDVVAQTRKHKKPATNNTVGIAVNTLDDMEKVMSLCNFISKRTGRRVIVRPHPKMMNKFDTNFFIDKGVELSDSRKESSYDFFAHIGVLVANESAIHLDAAVYGIQSILYNFSKNAIIDWYSYLRNGLMPHAKSFDELEDLLNASGLQSVDKVRYYYAAYQTPYDGHVGETIAEFVTQAKSQENAIRYLENSFSEIENNVYVIRSSKYHN